VIAAPSTGQGKTTIATGLMAALRSAGHEISGHKVGPDYIDPGYHALATGRPGRNLDPHLVGEDRIVPLLLHGATTPTQADVAVIEGVMGLYDGRVGTGGFSSTAHVASLTESAVVLVLDVARLSRSAGAIVAGMAAYDPDINIAGVVLNRAGSTRNVDEIIRSMERTGIPVLGALPKDDRLAAPSRHLGLVPVEERDASIATIERLGEQVARHLDLDALMQVARAAPDLTATAWEPTTAVQPPATARAGTSAPVVAVAGGRAFTFRYAETEELLSAAGCEVVTFDPLSDTSLPENTQGIYLGGGFPEVYAAELAVNRSLLHDLRAALAEGIPTVAECAGLLYLARSLDDVPMAGVVPTSAAMSDRLTLRYPTATAASDSLLSRAGERVTGHEFHRTRTTPKAGTRAAWSIDGEAVGFASDTWHASYLHVHWAGHPQLAQRFADAVRAAAPHPTASYEPSRGPVEDDEEPRDPLRHHGDTEVSSGLLDFAVNVYGGSRPAWLDHVLHQSIEEVGAYPDVRPARHAVSNHHGRGVDDVLVTAGAAEAFSLVARLREWKNPVVVHPQFTEPHAALEAHGHKVTTVFCLPEDGFLFHPSAIPDDADLVVIGNPTNPTGVLHPAAVIRRLRRRGRLVVVDEAFMDSVPGQLESLAGEHLDGLLVVRSLTKLWGIPGIRAGYVLGDRYVIRQMSEMQSPWSVSTSAVAAAVACSTENAAAEARERTTNIVRWREVLERGLRNRGVELVTSSAPFVLARLGAGARAGLRDHGIAVRRTDTFPGLDASWVRIAVRPPTMTARLLTALDHLRIAQPGH
jgi:cobyrinic acid a,c-diamide synthase